VNYTVLCVAIRCCVVLCELYGAVWYCTCTVLLCGAVRYCVDYTVPCDGSTLSTILLSTNLTAQLSTLSEIVAQL
jgi:hypothetical protein